APRPEFHRAVVSVKVETERPTCLSFRRRADAPNRQVPGNPRARRDGPHGVGTAALTDEPTAATTLYAASGRVIPFNSNSPTHPLARPSRRSRPSSAPAVQ